MPIKFGVSVFDFEKGLKTLTSKYDLIDFSKQLPQTPLAAISRRALGSVLALLMVSCSPVRGCRCGSMTTFQHTSNNNDDVISHNPLCHLVGKPPFGHERI